MQEEMHILSSVSLSYTGHSTEDNLSVCSYSSSWFIFHCLCEKYTQALQLHWPLVCGSNPRNICTFWFEKMKVGQKLYQVTETSQNYSSPSALSPLSPNTKELMLHYQWCIFLRMFAFPQDRPCVVNTSFHSLLDVGLCPLLLQDTKPYCIENY